MEKMNRNEDRSMVNKLEEQQRLMMLRSQGMPPPPASNQHVNHINNLEEEQQRLMMLDYHRRFQAMPRPQHTDPSSSSNTKKAPVYPPGSRFLPTNLGCVRVHLRNKVDKNKSGFIRTLDLYKDDPWLLKHVKNDLFPRGEWYYFTPRNRRGISSCNRTVMGSGGGGTWKSTSKKEPIMDKDNKVQGYMQNLVYNKTNVNGDIKPTGWNMTEYCLHKENQDGLVLCHLKGNIKKNEFAEEVNKKNILPNQVQEEEAGANRVEIMKTLQEDHGDPTQHQQQQDALALALPPHEGQVMTQNNARTTMQQEDYGDATQQQHEQYGPVLALPSPHVGQDLGFETTMTTQNNNDNNFMPTMQQEDYGDATQQQQDEDAPVLALPSPHVGQDLGFETTMTTQNNNDNNFTPTMLQQDHGDPTPQQQQEQDAPALPFPSYYEDQDPSFDTIIATWDADLRYHWDDPNVCFSVEDLLMEDDVNEGYLQQPVSQAPDALGGSDAPGGSAD